MRRLYLLLNVFHFFLRVLDIIVGAIVPDVFQLLLLTDKTVELAQNEPNVDSFSSVFTLRLWEVLETHQGALCHIFAQGCLR